MSRTRLIKPALFENEVLGQLPGDAALLFCGLWCLADRDGRLEDRPMRIKAKLFAYRAVDVNKYLNALHEHRFIVRYEVGGERFIEIPTWAKHQRPHNTEKASAIPASASSSTPPLSNGEVALDNALSSNSNGKYLPLTLNPSPLTDTFPGGVAAPGEIKQVDPNLARARRLFRHRDSTPLDSSELSAWKKNKGVVAATQEEDWQALEWYYASRDPEIANYRSRGLSKALGNWNTEIRTAHEKLRTAPRSEKKIPAAKEPAGWQAALAKLYPDSPPWENGYAALTPEMRKQIDEALASEVIA